MTSLLLLVLATTILLIELRNLFRALTRYRLSHSGGRRNYMPSMRLVPVPRRPRFHHQRHAERHGR
jgi:hypothetical protein